MIKWFYSMWCELIILLKRRGTSYWVRGTSCLVRDFFLDDTLFCKFSVHFILFWALLCSQTSYRDIHFIILNHLFPRGWGYYQQDWGGARSCPRSSHPGTVSSPWQWSETMSPSFSEPPWTWTTPGPWSVLAPCHPLLSSAKRCGPSFRCCFCAVSWGVNLLP